jgi:hypothetical protein
MALAGRTRRSRCWRRLARARTRHAVDGGGVAEGVCAANNRVVARSEVACVASLSTSRWRGGRSETSCSFIRRSRYGDGAAPHGVRPSAARPTIGAGRGARRIMQELLIGVGSGSDRSQLESFLRKCRCSSMSLTFRVQGGTADSPLARAASQFAAGLAHVGEALGLVEPTVHRADDALLRWDAARKERLQQASRSTAPSIRELDRRERFPLGAVRVVGAVGVLRRCVVAPVRDALTEALGVCVLDRREAPVTPCAWPRCAPGAAARGNVRPHFGHVNSAAFSV